MKKNACLFLAFFFLFSFHYAKAAAPEIVTPNAVVMEKTTGKVLYQKDEHKKLPPASVTKVMTLLLVMEAVDSGKITLDDVVTVSEYAAGMGGSQVFLEPGEQMSVNDLLKATVIASGNDSATALAEYVAGSEDAFVSLMNTRAKELGMNDTSFKNCTGLDSEGHYTSAYDIALMSRELIKHEKIKNYTTIWIDNLRNGAFQLANTNKLIRSYKGITGLKTGSTSVAKFCLSATAERDNMELIAVLLAAPSSKERFNDARALLDFGFANYTLYNMSTDTELPPVAVSLGETDLLSLDFGTVPSVLIEKNKLSSMKHTYEIPESVCAPVEKGQKIGCAKILSGETLLSEIPIVAAESIKKLGWSGVFRNLLTIMFMC